MTLSIPLLFPGTIPVVADGMETPLLPVGTDADRPRFADCLSGLYVAPVNVGNDTVVVATEAVVTADAAAADGVVADAGGQAAVPVYSRVHSNLPTAGTVDDLPVPVDEAAPVPEGIGTAGSARREPPQHLPDASWPPEGLSSLLLVPVAFAPPPAEPALSATATAAAPVAAPAVAPVATPVTAPATAPVLVQDASAAPAGSVQAEHHWPFSGVPVAPTATPATAPVLVQDASAAPAGSVQAEHRWPFAGVPVAPTATPATAPVLAQDASAAPAGSVQAEHRWPFAVQPEFLQSPGSEPAAGQGSDIQVPQSVGALRAQTILLPAPATDSAQPEVPADARPPESTLPALATAAARIDTPAPAAATPSPDSAAVAAAAPAPAAPALSVAAPPSAVPVSAPLPDPAVHAGDFPERIAAHLHWLAEQGIGHARIHITPRELGPVDIHLTLAGDQLHADFSAVQPEVRQALEHSLPQLRQLLEQHGLHLAHADVGHQRRQSGAGTADGEAGSASGAAAPPQAEPGESGTPAPARLSAQGSLHLVDAYA